MLMRGDISVQKVLIVDDEQRTLDGVAQRVQTSGLPVSIVGLAHDGIEALELTRLRRPGIVLCDIRMPGMDGIAYALKAKEMDPDIAVIFMSGYSDREYLKTAIRIGAIDYLDKPVDEEQFLQALTNAVHRREQAEVKPAGQGVDAETLRLLLTSNSEELLTQAAGPWVSAEGSYIVLAAMMYAGEANDDSEQLINMFTLHMISTFSEENQYRYATVRMGNQIILLVKDEAGGDVQGMEERVRRLASGMIEGLPEAGSRFSIGIGCPFGRLVAAGKSYQMAMSALERTFYLGIGSVIPEMCSKTGDYRPDEGQFRDIDTCCSNNEMLRVTEIVERLVTKFAENHGTPVFQVRSAVLRISQILCQNYRNQFLEELPDSGPPLQKAIMQAFTLEDLAAILRKMITRYTNTILTMDKKNGAIYSAKKYIWKHMERDISVKELAQAVYLSPTYLCALFKEVTGLTINQYVQQARIDKAKSLLLNSDLTVNEVAGRVGYSNIGYFSKLFQLHAGTSPQLYRKNT